MTPYYTNTGITIYNGDCVNVMREAIDDDSVNIVITSPPYNLGNNHHTGNKRHNPYDDDMPEDEYQQSQLVVLLEIYRVLQNDGWLFYNHKNRIKNGRMISPLEWILKSNFILRQEIVWNVGSPNMDDCRFYPFTERIYCLAKSDASTMKNALKLTDDWHIAPVGTQGAHTRAFPETIPDRLLACVSGNFVFDPYVGSGTTAASAQKFNREFIGSDISAEYCELAVQRTSQQVMAL